DAVTHMAIADPMALRDPGPDLSEHRASGSERQGKEHGHDGSGNPAVLDGRISAPDHPGHRRGAETVEQDEGQALGCIDVRPVAAKGVGDKSNGNAVLAR